MYAHIGIEFTPPAWSSWQIRDIATSEKGQEKGLRIITGLRGDSYEERCREAGWETLEAREKKKIQDNTQAFKILKGIDKMDPEKLYPARRTTRNTRQSSSHGT